MKVEATHCCTRERTRLEIDLSKVRGNYAKIAARVAPAEVLSVIKADAYGMGAVRFAQTLHRAGCRRFGFACPSEALAVSSLALKGLRVHLLSAVLPDEVEPMILAGAALPVTGLGEAEFISKVAVKLGRKARVHFKIDTGMGRLGILASDAPGVILKAAKMPALVCEGLMTHFPVADDASDGKTLCQVQTMKKIVAFLVQRGIVFDHVHCAASDGINNFRTASQAPFTLVRAGLDLHGGFSDRAARLGLEQVFSLKSRVVQVRDLPAGCALGYGGTFVLRRRSRIALIAAGYADGVPLAASNRGHVLIGGRRCPFVGRVSMDYSAVDVSRAGAVSVGDDVVLLGGDGRRKVTPGEWAALKGTHAHDILCAIGPRVERVYRG